MKKMKLKDRHPNVYYTVKRIIDDVDPEGFDPGGEDGCPENEYSIEVNPITLFLVENWDAVLADPSILTEEINRVWQQYFSSECRHANEIAVRILRDLPPDYRP